MDAVIVTGASAKEIAALVLTVQERQVKENFTPFDVIKEAVQKAIDGTAEASQDSLSPLSDT